MALELIVPSVGESVAEVEIGDWLKPEGAPVKKDEAVAVLETDKATMEVFAPADGHLTKILKPKGQKVAVGEVIAHIEPGPAIGSAPVEPKSAASPAHEAAASPRVMPAAARLLAEKGISPASVTPTGPGGRVLKEDVARAEAAPATPQPSPEVGSIAEAKPPATGVSASADREEELVPMSLIRRRIAQRLLEAQSTMALLTTFNEIDMSEVMALRQQHQETFQERHQVKLGFMSFFVKATIEALKTVPGLNAEVREDHIAYRNYFDIGVAIGGGRGLVVPVLRNAERMSFAEIEKAIAEYAKRVKENKIRPDDLTGGTFTLTNGGIYGSLLSTPLINAPQSGVLGLHAIQERPVALRGQVVIRPMMYVALTYDHRIVDGREAVTFLRLVKDMIEQPARILLEI